jgi:hypothetical protein
MRDPRNRPHLISTTPFNLLPNVSLAYRADYYCKCQSEATAEKAIPHENAGYKLALARRFDRRHPAG